MAVRLFTSPGFAQVDASRYALILQDPPVTSRYSSREAVETAAARSYRQKIEAAQRTLRKELASREIRVTGSVSTLLNALFVVASQIGRAHV